MLKPFLDVEVSFLCGRCKGFCTLPKVSKTWRFYSSFKNVGRRGTFEEDLQRCFSRGRRSTRDTWVRHVRRFGREFPEKGCILHILPHQILRLAKSRWFCVTGVALRMTCLHFFVSGAVIWTQGVKKWQNVLVWGRQLCTQLSIFEWSVTESLRFWCCQLRKLGKSCRIAWLLMFSTSKLKEVSQNCVVVNFKNSGSLAKLLRYWWCQLWKLRKSCRIASF